MVCWLYDRDIANQILISILIWYFQMQFHVEQYLSIQQLMHIFSATQLSSGTLNYRKGTIDNEICT